MTEAAMGYQYRCERCKTTSPSVLTQAGATEERRRHREEFHGGHVPDGEQIIQPEPFRPSDIPPGQWIAGGLMALLLVILIMARAA
ncbi:hypothetical protein GCM10010387_16000 [Streptomyces inusitatus]|uniref:Uncharacterized protein n=1 Tax=Streptomyces inusitatus TaxID=68221 RepID=A0A918PX18_9ACTN|nr:hypothetical protein [Streptomyces inusitatus]GGZ23604.1 hypothetical protein GCM10010387_16000 [Streptomyces inusitatus]